MGVMNYFELRAAQLQPDPQFKYAGDPTYELDQRFLASLVGGVALGLPVVMLIAVLTGRCFYDSISHFYYSQFFGDVLVVALAFIGTFLIAYRGDNWLESRLAGIAGLFAYFIAVFPTTERGCDLPAFSGRVLADLTVRSPDDPAMVEPATRLGQYFELFDHVDRVHFGSAAVLFLFLAYYSFVVFRRIIPEEHVVDGRLTPAKRIRNRIYFVSGSVIVFSIAALAAKAATGRFLGVEFVHWWNGCNLTFWFETAALWAFGVSWMVKGRFWGRLLLDERDKRVRAAARANAGG